MSDNRRSSHRYNVTLTAHLTVDGETQEVVIENISLGGAQLALDQRLTMGQRVQILFELPTKNEPIEAHGTVRWNSDESVGVQFEGLRARDVWALNKFFENNK